MTPKQAVLKALDANRRLPELEPIILQNAVAACFYAKNLVKGRWEAAESVMAGKVHSRLAEFNVLDEDTRPVTPSGYRMGPQGEGTGHVKSGGSLSLLTVYMRLVKCRVPAFEAVLSSHGWKGEAYKYTQLIYRHAGELIDLDCPEICSWMIRDLVFGRTFKTMSRPERIRVCEELHRRMILHSFAHGDDYHVRNYFREQKKSENYMLLMLTQHNPDMKVGDLIQKVVEGL
jgi:hypothetical protein